MTTILSNPLRAQVRTEISLQEAIAAVADFAERYPVERLSSIQIEQLEQALTVMKSRVNTCLRGADNKV